MLNAILLEDFKQHMKNHWIQHGSPGDVSDVSKKALYTGRDVHVNRDVGLVTTCEVCNRKSHTGEKCWKDEKNANMRPSCWKTFDKDEEFRGKCFQCGETGHKGYQCNKKPTAASVFEDIAMATVEENMEKQEIVISVME